MSQLYEPGSVSSRKLQRRKATAELQSKGYKMIVNNKKKKSLEVKSSAAFSHQKLLQTCSTEGFQVMLPFGIVFGWYLAGDPRQ
jgi:hypothetical protein